MEAYVKYNRFHIEHRMHHTPNPFSAEGMYYNKEKDFYVCPMGQHMERTGTKHGKTDSGYITESARYRAGNCSGCPLRGQCFKAKGNRVIEVNHRLNAYKRKAAELLTSEEGIRHRADDALNQRRSSDKSKIIWHTVVSGILERTRLLWTFLSSQSHLISKNYAKGF